MNLQIIIVVVVKIPFFPGTFSLCFWHGGVGSYPMSHVPWVGSHALSEGVKQFSQTLNPYLGCDNPWNPKLVSYMLTAPVQVILREPLALRVSQHRLVVVLRIKELWLNYTGSPDPCFSGLKNGMVTFCWHCRECELCWWIWDLPLKSQAEVLVLQHQLCFLRLSLWHLSLLHMVPCSDTCIRFMWFAQYKKTSLCYIYF